HSRDDVLLSIELVREMRARFGVDAVTFSPYEGGPCEKFQRKPNVFACLDTNYDLSKPERSTVIPVSILCADHRYALWVDLERDRDGKGRGAVLHRKKKGGYFFIDREHSFDEDWLDVAKR